MLPAPRTVGNFQGGSLENAVQQVGGRFKTKSGPPNGVVFRADNQGNVTSYATYDSNGNIKSRVDLDPTSAPHYDKVTGKIINPPHVVDYPTNVLPDGSVRSQTNAGVIRAAQPEDIP
ncbi:polymorphic toxin type 24 domain-containing protein [uncultured Rheinheimera sp.]|uniref:polymorphic toxin type 24 domain-containing protein n=1 Tax=uncultured Rheinheimera sp. TaxID=400532 RepID=UPI0033900481